MRKRLGNLDQLLLSYAETANGSMRIDCKVQIGQQRCWLDDKAPASELHPVFEVRGPGKYFRRLSFP